jgi:hypothetical protein
VNTYYFMFAGLGSDNSAGPGQLDLTVSYSSFDADGNPLTTDAVYPSVMMTPAAGALPDVAAIQASVEAQVQESLNDGNAFTAVWL